MSWLRGRRAGCNEAATDMRSLIKSVGLLSDNYSVSGMVSRYLCTRYGALQGWLQASAVRCERGGEGLRRDVPYKYLGWVAACLPTLSCGALGAPLARSRGDTVQREELKPAASRMLARTM
uniref:Uncharacterized protein n=1 Tax=Heliothis virescens TaxID=7102 RepID=A0A2A4K5Y3_HELVI